MYHNLIRRKSIAPIVSVLLVLSLLATTTSSMFAVAAEPETSTTIEEQSSNADEDADREDEEPTEEEESEGEEVSEADPVGDEEQDESEAAGSEDESASGEPTGSSEDDGMKEEESDAESDDKDDEQEAEDASELTASASETETDDEQEEDSVAPATNTATGTSDTDENEQESVIKPEAEEDRNENEDKQEAEDASELTASASETETDDEQQEEDDTASVTSTATRAAESGDGSDDGAEDTSIEEAGQSASVMSSMTETETTPTSTSATGTASTDTLLTGTTTSGTTTSTGTQVSGADVEPASEEDTTNVKSGKAVALANILNVINTNVVNSEGVVFFSNFFETLFGSIDLRNLFSGGASSTCSLSSCSGDHTEVNIQNDGQIDNDIFLEANSGGNEIENADNAAIETGDAYAGLNLVNIANMNFVDSNYLLVTINAFNDLVGDVIFPSADNFLSNASNSTVSSTDITNDAELNNNIDIDADSGGNEMNNVGGGTTTTGNATSQGNVFNQLNTSLIGDTSVTILFRVHGDWAGEVFGAPDDVLWTVGPDGSIFLVDTDDAGGTGGVGTGGSTSIIADNQVSINNNVKVAALTGDNAITNADTGLISTGDAYAGANIINLANGNVIGKNWVLAIVNIFGNFQGNIAFGQPDLWIGEQIETERQVKNGSELTYKYTIINNGDSRASDVVLTDQYAHRYLDILDASDDYTVSGGNLVWQLGTIPAGGAVEVSYRARISDAGYETTIENVASVRSRENDANLDDNTDTAAVVTMAKPRNGGVQITRTGNRESAVDAIAESAALTNLEVERLTETSALSEFSPTVRQSILVRNTSDVVAKNVIFRDILTDASGKIIQDEAWDFGDVLPNEEIQIGYNITFGNAAQEGEYRLTSVLVGENFDTERLYNGSLWFTRATEAIASEMPSPQVAGVAVSIPPAPPVDREITRRISGIEAMFLAKGTSGTSTQVHASDQPPASVLEALSLWSSHTSTPRAASGPGLLHRLLGEVMAILSSLTSFVVVDAWNWL